MSKKFNGRLTDELGELLAIEAELKGKIDVIKARLKAEGPGAYEGELFRAVVSDSTAKRLDMIAVREKLTEQFIRAHTNVVLSRSVKVFSRSGEGV